MKLTHNYLSIFMLILIGFSVSSCSKDDHNPNPNPGTGQSKISMKINGVLWEGTEDFTSGLVSDYFAGSAKKKVNDKKQTLSFGFYEMNPADELIISDDSKGAILFLDEANPANSWSIGNGGNKTTGKLKITKTKAQTGSVLLASATFSGTTKDGDGNVIIITEGKIINALTD